MLSIILAISGGFLYRWRGAAHRLKKYTPRPVTQIMFAFPYALACVPPATDSLPLAGLVWLFTTLAVLTGHGGWMDLGTWDKDREDERLEFIIKPLHGKIPEYWYDVLGMSITGIAITLPAGIALSCPVLALSGGLKGLAYILGWKFFDASAATARAEWLTGFFLWGSLAWIIL